MTEIQRSFVISFRDLVPSIALFVGLIGLFAVLSGLVGWPRDEGWTVVVLVSLALASVPVAARMLAFLRESRARLDVQGIKLDFSGSSFSPPDVRLPDNILDPGLEVMDSAGESMLRAAHGFAQATAAVIDLKAGQAWYETRLFALAATAVRIGAPRHIVFTSQREQEARRFIGAAPAIDVLKSMLDKKPRYREVWEFTTAILEHLRLYAVVPDHVYPPAFSSAVNYVTAYRDHGDLVLLRILIQEMRFPSRPSIDGTIVEALEKPQDPPWLSADEVERLLDPWLVRRSIDLDAPKEIQIKTLLSVEGELVPALRNGRYAGLIDVSRAMRALLSQALLQAR